MRKNTIMSTNQESRISEDAEIFATGLVYDLSFFRQFVEFEKKKDPERAAAHDRRLAEIEEQRKLLEEAENETEAD